MIIKYHWPTPLKKIFRISTGIENLAKGISIINNKYKIKFLKVRYFKKNEHFSLIVLWAARLSFSPKKEGLS